MAKIVVEYDSVGKTMKIMKDGTEIPNARYASFYPNYDNEDDVCCDIRTMVHDEENDVEYVEHIMANKAIFDIAQYLKK